MQRKPVIGIVSNYDLNKGGYFCLSPYVHSIEKAGAMPLILPYLGADAADTVLDLVSGIVLTGGGDFAPELQGLEPHPSLVDVVPERDIFEFALARAALGRNIPILGICRGMQLLNVLGGGEIFQHTLDSMPEAADHRDGTALSQTVHDVEVVPDTLLSRLCGEEASSFAVNSMHHQAISRLASGYKVSARAHDGVIEAIESVDHEFVVGVQWHPEWMFDSEPACRSLLRNFANACIIGDNSETHN